MLLGHLEAIGQMPLPPYIKPAKRGGDAAGPRATIRPLFARRDGAVAAPTAALHFTAGLLARAGRGAASSRAFVTLHVGAGTFLPVKAEDTAEHRMHAEWCEVSPQTAAAVDARARARRARGRRRHHRRARRSRPPPATTARLVPFAGETRLFITPGYRFRVVDLLLTNFHLPRSTLFMLVAAFAGAGHACAPPTPTRSPRATASIPTATPAC